MECEKCKQYSCKGSCRKYTVYDQDYGEDLYYYAHSEEEAAESHAEKYNEEGGLIDGTKEIMVDGKAYLISAAVSINYTARRMK